MNPFEAIADFLGILSGKISPKLVVYGFLLGFFVAFLPMGLLEPATWLLIFLVIFTRASLGFFLLVASIVKGIMALGLWKLVAATGLFVLEIKALEGFWRSFLDIPGIALFGFDRYTAMGGLVWALLFSLVLWWPIYKGVVSFREKLLPRVEDARWFRWLKSSWFGIVVETLFFRG